MCVIVSSLLISAAFHAEIGSTLCFQLLDLDVGCDTPIGILLNYLFFFFFEARTSRWQLVEQGAVIKSILLRWFC